MSIDSDTKKHLTQILPKSRYVTKGDVLLISKPFAYVLKSSLRGLYCENCLRRKQNLRRCSRCKLSFYCHIDCQKGLWDVHKKECMELKKLKPNFPPDTVRLLARIIFRLNDGGHEVSEKIDERHSRRFKDLMNHYSDLKNDQKRLEHFSVLVQALEKYIGKENIPNPADLLGIYGRLCVNSYCIVDKELNSIGTGIYLAGSIFDHSCSPNAYASFVESELVVRSLVDWPSLDLNKVRISYIDVLNSTKNRRIDLSSYYFTCDCVRCLDERRERFNSSIRCGNNACDAPVTIEDDLNYSIKPCPKCGFSEFEEGTVEKYLEIIKFTQEKHEEMKEKNYLDVCQLLIKRQEPFLHPYNVWCVKTLDAAFEAAIDLQCFEIAVQYGTANLSGLRFHYGSKHPSYAMMLLKLGKINLFLFKFADAHHYLEEAEPILRVSHGVDSPLYREELSPILKQARMELQMVKNGGFNVKRNALPY